MNAIEIKGLTKTFGTHRVLDHMDLSVPAGSVFGLVGENGAGKTTTMKIILGLMPKDSGNIEIFGEDASRSRAAAGYLPDVPSFYGYMNAREYMTLCGGIGGIDKDILKPRIDKLLKLVGIENAKTRVSNYSRGMKQRLGIAQALLTKPDILICDEPTSALDPSGRKDILDIIRGLGGDTTVIFSTHILSDVEKICDRVALMHDGRIVMCGPIDELEDSRRTNEIEVEFGSADETKRFADALREARCSYRLDGHAVVAAGNKDLDNGKTIIDILYNEKIVPLRMAAVEPDLEKLFMEMIK